MQRYFNKISFKRAALVSKFCLFLFFFLVFKILKKKKKGLIDKIILKVMCSDC